MANILLSAPTGKPWSPGHALREALEQTGHAVDVFDYESTPDLGAALLASVDGCRPDLHIVYGLLPYPPELIRSVRERGVYNVLWFPAITPYPVPEVIALGRAHDLFFTVAQGLVEPFRQAGIPHAEWLPEAMHPSPYGCDDVTDVERRLFTCDVTLVGKLESDNPAYMERWKLVKRIVDEGIDFKWWGPRIRQRIGTFVLGLLLSKVSRAYGGRFVWGKTYALAVHLSRVFIARDAYPHIRLSMSSRMFTALGLGAFYLTYPTSGLAEMFEPDKELVTFSTADEMIEKIRYYLAHEDKRSAIAAAGRRKALAEHTYARRFGRMFELIGGRGGPMGGS